MLDAASGFYGFPGIGIAVGRSRFYQASLAFVAVAAISTGFLTAGALLLAPDPEAVLSHALNFFAVAAMAIALLWVGVIAGLLSRIARTPSVPMQFFLVFLLAAGAVFLWVVLMHLGTWFEWQVKRTPTAYGTEWFYAEPYMEYIREPVGQLISLTVALIVALPAAPCVFRACFLVVCKLVGPILSPLLDRLVAARRGVLGLLALLVALFTSILSP